MVFVYVCVCICVCVCASICTHACICACIQQVLIFITLFYWSPPTHSFNLYTVIVSIYLFLYRLRISMFISRYHPTLSIAPTLSAVSLYFYLFSTFFSNLFHCISCSLNQLISLNKTSLVTGPNRTHKYWLSTRNRWKPFRSHRSQKHPPPHPPKYSIYNIQMYLYLYHSLTKL